MLVIWLGEAESCTCVVKVVVGEGVVGVPLSTPAGLSCKPAGGAPEIMDHETGAAPPPLCSVVEYGTPTIASGKVGAVATTSGAAMRMLRFCVFVCCGVPVSCTCTTK